MSFLRRLTQARSPNSDQHTPYHGSTSLNTQSCRRPRRKASSSSSDVPKAPAVDRARSDLSIPRLTLSVDEGPVRLFICDRRRAILERIPPSSSLTDPPVYNEKGDPVVPRAVFMDEQYSNMQTEDKAWAFKFDLKEWAEKHNIQELHLQNFCSFLNRENRPIVLDGARKHDGSGGSAGPSHPPNMYTPPLSANSRSPPPLQGSTTAGSDQASWYHTLPSSQLLRCNDAYSKFDSDTIETLETMSGGRLERLADALMCVEPEKIVFRDHSCYAQRPPIMIFWFLKLMKVRSIPALTLDSIQGTSQVLLHEMLPLNRVDRLTVIQPANKIALMVTDAVLIDWLRGRDPKEQSGNGLELVLKGHTQVTIQGVIQFIKLWRDTAEPVIFDRVSIDICGFRVIDFVQAIEERMTVEAEWRPPTPPASTSFGIPAEEVHELPHERIFSVRHKKNLSAVITYAFINDSLSFTSMICPPVILGPTPSMNRAQSLHTFQQAHKLRQHHNRSMTRQGSMAGSPESGFGDLSESEDRFHASIVEKMFSFLLRSNA